MDHHEGIPGKVTNIVKAMYESFKCTVIDEGQPIGGFRITSGLKQGCVMLGFLFLLVIDWAMRKTMEGMRTGIRWNFTSLLEHLRLHR